MSEHKQPSQEGTHKGIELEDLQKAVNEEASPLFEFLVKHAKIIIAVVAVIVLAAAGYGGVRAWSNYSQNKAAKQLAQVLSLSGEERIEALRQFAPNAPDHVKGGALFELAGSLMTSGEFEEAAGVWGQIEAMGNPEMRSLARMGRARCLLLGGKADEALAAAQQLMADAPEALQAPGNRLLAACAEAAGDKEAAIAALQALLDSGKAVDAPLLTYRIDTLKAQ